MHALFFKQVDNVEIAHKTWNFKLGVQFPHNI